MKNTEFKEFNAFLCDAMAFWRQPVSEFTVSVWWGAAKPFDLVAIKDAFSRHALNPDNGQFAPKPADIVRAIGGTTADSALVAWSKVDLAVRSIGPYQSVAFNDPIIHRVLDDMGGWILLCGKSDDDWPFVAKEFQVRYRGYRLRGEIPESISVLPGIVERENGSGGFAIPAPVLIENRSMARMEKSAKLEDHSNG